MVSQDVQKGSFIEPPDCILHGLSVTLLFFFTFHPYKLLRVDSPPDPLPITPKLPHRLHQQHDPQYPHHQARGTKGLNP